MRVATCGLVLATTLAGQQELLRLRLNALGSGLARCPGRGEDAGGVELKGLVEKWLYGTMPPAPGNVRAKVREIRGVLRQ